MPELYKVGGCVRDKIMDVDPNDIDYVFINQIGDDIDKSYEGMLTYLKENNYKIFLETKECFTIRAKDAHNIVADFVLGRKEIDYDSDTRKPKCVPGSLYDDLLRRDFTINAIAEDKDGNLYDFFNGIEDIHKKILRTPFDPNRSFGDDPLRLIRAMRFKITKGFVFSDELGEAFNNTAFWDKLSKVVSKERIRDELYKCFSYDTVKTIKCISELSEYQASVLFNNNLWLKPTFEKKK